MADSWKLSIVLVAGADVALGSGCFSREGQIDDQFDTDECELYALGNRLIKSQQLVLLFPSLNAADEVCCLHWFWKVARVGWFKRGRD